MKTDFFVDKFKDFINTYTYKYTCMRGGIIMAQVSLYIEDSMAEQLAAAAKNHNCSVSKYAASVIFRNLSEDKSKEINKKQLLKQLCGALDDPAFTIPSELPWENEIPRSFDLI
jgi:hypothetical protein